MSAASSPPEPDWDMTPYFEQLDCEAYQAFRRELDADVEKLQRDARALGEIDRKSLGHWRALLERLEGVTARSGHLGSYLGCMAAADARSEAIKREAASAAAARAGLEKVFVVLRAALRDVDDALYDELVASAPLSEVAYFLGRQRTSARLRMEADLEELATDLGVDGISAWGRLYNQVSGGLEFDLELPDREPQHLPVSVTRSLLEDADPEVRRAALAGSNAAWESVAEVTAACINAIAGTRHALYRRRGIADFLEPALFDAGISRATLDALLDAVTSRQEVARRFLARKARILGRPDGKLGFQDLMAPLPVAAAARIPWPEGRQRIEAAFAGFYPDLAAFAKRAFDRRWLDYSPRPGKRPGGFCSTSAVIGESRIFLTYNEALGDLSTVAHELGHAFHGWLMKDMRPWTRRYPMTLAETASTFAEQLVIDAVLSDASASAEERAVVLDSRMQDGATFLLNIPMRFAFEKAFYEERADGEVGVSRLKQLMVDAQRSCYGDCLAEGEHDPWFWASKLHFYITGTSFYNFPYTFGYLFSMGIFARAQAEGAGFLPDYEALLRLTGSDTTEAVARRSLGVDLEKPDFWHASIDLVERDLALFEKTADDLFA